MLNYMAAPSNYFRRDPDGESFRLVERTLEPTMLALSILFIPILAGPLVADLSDESRQAMEISGWAIWAAFVAEYVWLLLLAPNRKEMIRTHKLDLLIIVLSFLRPLRVLRLLRLATATSGIGRAFVALKRIGGRPGFQPFFGAVGGIIITGAALALAFEHEQQGSTLSDFADALWWSIVTCTTVGYGDHFPVTTGGQIVAVTLMIVGIAALSMLTASIAALFVAQDDEPGLTDLRDQLNRIEHLLTNSAHTPSKKPKTSQHGP